MKRPKNPILITLIIALGMGFSIAAANSDTLDQARNFVKEKSYLEALQLYEGMQDGLRADSGLLIEWARVYTYADLHPQAIALFEEIRKKFPQREREILPELADQYKWDGQTRKSIEIYHRAEDLGANDIQVKLGLAQALAWDKQYDPALKEYDAILAAQPDETRALLGKADVLSWNDKLEAANALYQRVLEKEPNNITAQKGLARNYVWQGWHRKGIRAYEEILAREPGNPDALEGIAFAYHWDGENILAVKRLERLLAEYPQRHAAGELYGEIENLKHLHLNQFNRYSYDSNKLSVLSNTLHSGAYIDNATEIGASYQRYLFRQPHQHKVSANRIGIDFKRRLNEYLQANTYLYLTSYDFEGFTPFTTNTWLTYWPNDILRFDFSYDRETFEDITALYNKIITDSWGFTVDVKPNRFWFFSGRYKRSAYSDDNNQNTVFAALEHRLKQNSPYIKLYYNFYYADWSKQLDHGYFNPHSIASHALGIYFSKALTEKLFLEGQASTGYERQDPKSNHPTYFGALGLQYRLTHKWQVSLREEYFDARDSDPNKSYSKNTVWLNITYRFGSEPKPGYQATQPQRPTAQ